jgi:DNA-binding response OmpR family regulator
MTDIKPFAFYAEDDPFMIRMYERIFKLNNFDVEFAFDGSEAIEKLRKIERMPDIILLDVMMPKTNGLEVLKFIKGEEKLKNIPIILLSNLANREEQARGIEMGAVDYLVKSDHQPKDVVEKIRAVIVAHPQAAV